MLDFVVDSLLIGNIEFNSLQSERGDAMSELRDFTRILSLFFYAYNSYTRILHCPE